VYKIPSYLFKKLYQKGKTKKINGIILRYFQNNKPFSRFGFVISAKDASKAVERNKLKRRAKEIVKTIKTPPSFDYVFIFKKEMSFDELKLIITKLLND